MINQGRVKSTAKPETLIVDEYSVWVSSNIKQVEEKPTENEKEGFIGWEYDLVQYNKDEYIQIIADKTTIVEKQLNDTQLALCEIYEGMM